MNPEQIKRLAQYYLSSSLEEGEAARLNQTHLDDDEHESISLALTDVLEDTEV